MFNILQNIVRQTVRLGRIVIFHITNIASLITFLTISLHPFPALAFVNDIELSRQQLIFIRDDTLRDRAIVGIEAFPENQKTVGDILSQNSFIVRFTPQTGTVVRVLATAYSSTVSQTDASPFITASGKQVGRGIVAANFLPFGTEIKINGYIYAVWDRMNSRYDDKYIIDIWQPSLEAAQAHGVRVVDMEVLSLPQ